MPAICSNEGPCWWVPRRPPDAYVGLQFTAKPYWAHFVLLYRCTGSLSQGSAVGGNEVKEGDVGGGAHQQVFSQRRFFHYISQENVRRPQNSRILVHAYTSRNVRVVLRNVSHVSYVTYLEMLVQFSGIPMTGQPNLSGQLGTQTRASSGPRSSTPINADAVSSFTTQPCLSTSINTIIAVAVPTSLLQYNTSMQTSGNPRPVLHSLALSSCAPSHPLIGHCARGPPHPGSHVEAGTRCNLLQPAVT